MKLFLSYGHKDYPAFLNRIVLDLRQEHDVWLDSLLRWGDNWPKMINDAIDDCDLFIFIKSIKSVRADSYCYYEIAYAQEKGREKPIRVISVDDAPMPSVIEESQWFDMDMAVNILDELDEEEYEKCLERLLIELRNFENGETESLEKWDIPTAPVPEKLRESLEESCAREIYMKYGSSGIVRDYLSVLRLKNEYPGLSKTYQTLSEMVSDFSSKLANRPHNRDLRLLITGDVYVGKSTHLLDFWGNTLNETGNSRVVFYVPPYALNQTDPFSYIYKTWLQQIPALYNKEPQEAFRIFKSKVGKNRKVVILIDDYDKIQCKKEMDYIFKYEDLLIDHVDVIIKIRYRDASWPRNYIEVLAVGVNECTIIEELHKSHINPADVKSILPSLSSPWLLGLLVNTVAKDAAFAINPGRLIRKSIRNRVEAAVRSDTRQMDILRFSILELLPQLESIHDYYETHMYRTLPGIIEKVAERGGVSEGFEVLDHLNELHGSPKKIFLEYYHVPVVKKMGLMYKPIQNEAPSKAYVWKDNAVGNYYYAEAILRMLDAEAFDEALQLIEDLVEKLLLLEELLEKGESNPLIFVCFDRARYLLDLADDEELQVIRGRWPKQLASLYVGMALVYELLGNNQEEFDVSLKALTLLNWMSTCGFDDTRFLVRWLSTMAYFVIKSREIIPESALFMAMSSLKTALQILEKTDVERDFIGMLGLSKVYGNIGAYYLRKKQYSVAMEWHQKSLNTKRHLMEVQSGDMKKTEEGIRRSLICLATDCYNLGRYQESIEFLDQAIETGERIQSHLRYEAYSRKAGSMIAYFREQSSWSVENVTAIMDLLVYSLVIMGDVVNRTEVIQIFRHAKRALAEIVSRGIELPKLNGSDIYIKAVIIENHYNMVTLNNDNSLTDYFEKHNP